MHDPCDSAHLGAGTRSRDVQSIGLHGVSPYDFGRLPERHGSSTAAIWAGGQRLREFPRWSWLPWRAAREPIARLSECQRESLVPLEGGTALGRVRSAAAGGKRKRSVTRALPETEEQLGPACNACGRRGDPHTSRE